MSAEGILVGLSHPLRARVLALFDDREASPKEVAQLLGERLGNVSYHVRVLREAGLLELTRTEPRRGAVEHFYQTAAQAGMTLSAELALDGDGWSDVDAALSKLNRSIARIAKRHPGEVHGRVVAVSNAL